LKKIRRNGRNLDENDEKLKVERWEVMEAIDREGRV